MRVFTLPVVMKADILGNSFPPSDVLKTAVHIKWLWRGKYYNVQKMHLAEQCSILKSQLKILD